MPKRTSSEEDPSIRRLGATLAQLRAHSGLTQKEVAQRMKTTQAAIARLERGEQSPSVRTLKSFAKANGFCLEIGFVRSATSTDKTGCILLLEDAVGAGSLLGAQRSPHPS